MHSLTVRSEREILHRPAFRMPGVRSVRRATKPPEADSASLADSRRPAKSTQQTTSVTSSTPAAGSSRNGTSTRDKKQG